MAYGVIWQYTTPENGELKKLMASPGSVLENSSEADAKKEGLQTLQEIAPEQRSCFKPLAIVEVTEEMLSELSGCPEVTMPMVNEDGEEDGELEFIDLRDTEFWAAQSWWHR
jgi:hypothetical protein